MNISKTVKSFGDIFNTVNIPKNKKSTAQNKLMSFKKKVASLNSFEEDFLEKAEKHNKEKTASLLPDPAKSLSSTGITNSLNSLPDITSKRTGSVIKSNIKNVLSKKYGELDTRNLFDDIDDKDIEDNIGTAEDTIKTNVDRGLLNKDYSSMFPNLRDGLALSFAAANKGKNKEATRAREAAYTERKEAINDRIQAKKTNEAQRLLNSFVKKNKSNLNLPKTEISGIAKKMNLNSVVNLLKLDLKGENNRIADFNKSVGNFDEKMKLSDSGIRTLGLPEAIEKGWENLKTKASDIYNDVKQGVKETWDDWTDNVSEAYNDARENYKDGDYLSAIMDLSRLNPATKPQADFAKYVSKAIWKWGADNYLRPKGYYFSAELLEHALQEKPSNLVYKSGSLPSNLIKEHPDFNTKLDKLLELYENASKPQKFKKDDFGVDFYFGGSEDLFFSIHKSTMYLDSIDYNHDGIANITLRISDDYDFTELWTAMDDKGISLGTIANDAGTITTKFDALNPFHFDIYITVRKKL